MAGRILVLDDEENYAEMLQYLLRENNYRVDMSTRPERALAQLEEIPYDLIISDYKMPVMDGSDFLKKARELYPSLPFILVSGLMNTPELVKVANMSVTLVMEKPLDTKEFLQHVARFSEPMTDEEKGELAKKPIEAASNAGETVVNFPEPPRFFSAVSEPSIRFMQAAWSIASAANEIFVFGDVGSDAELVVKDISVWHGNSDHPVTIFDFPDSHEEGVLKLQGILSDIDQSNTVCIRLADCSQIPMACELTQSVRENVDGAVNMLLVYIFESDEAAAHLKAVGDQGILLPALSTRPSDIASYARRFAKIASERSKKKNCAEFTPEVVYLLLSYDWPGGYRQLQDSVGEAVNSSGDDEAITVERMQKVLGIDEAKIASPDSRLLALMTKAQRAYLEKQILDSGTSAALVARDLDFEKSIQTRDDLINMPLVKSELAKF